MPIEIDAIIAKMEWAAQRGVSTYSSNFAGTRIHISRVEAPNAPSVISPEVAANAQSEPASADDKGDIVFAPMAGICHVREESGSAPFVSVGDKIEVGQTLCMIEAMKVMSAVTATESGTVDSILVEDGASVDAGTALIKVRA